MEQAVKKQKFLASVEAHIPQNFPFQNWQQRPL